METNAAVGFFALGVFVLTWIFTVRILKKKDAGFKNVIFRHVIGFFVGITSLGIAGALGEMTVQHGSWISWILAVVCFVIFLFFGFLVPNENKNKELERLNTELKATEDELEKIRALNKDLTQKNNALNASNKMLQKYNVILDAEEYAEQVKRDADEYKKQKYFDVDNERSEFNRSKFEIADEITKAKKELVAIKNSINGYSDEWIVPNQNAIDQIAEEYEFSELGSTLKEIRKEIKMMVGANLAAECEYAEPNRKRTAINFVIDAYNGKIDSILTKAKTDNYGILRQQMEDAFNLVNMNGVAFREARIREHYHSKRLEELKLLIAVNELRQQEREEQRQIKEQIREEERAKREYEKAMKQTQKEEDMIQKALEKMQNELEAANLEQRQKLEAQIAELEVKYKEAEEKNQRAISMAQQTRSGHVYVISNIGSFGEDVFKIGMTRRLEPTDRVKELGDASVPFSFDIHAMIYSDDAPTLENELHRRFKENQLNKVNPRKEFFNASLGDIKQAIDDLGYKAHWTLKAEAKEFRESLKLSKTLTH